MRHAVKQGGAFEALGCSVEELISHLQARLCEGANLRDYHVDHIRPCASFDFTDPEQIKQCFHYTNLQPLTPHENLSKGAKLLPAHTSSA